MNALKFRTQFELGVKLNKWFPKHMNRGYIEMERTLRKVDCIIEVHDSRIPFSGRNVQFINRLKALKPHILIMNKTDLLDLRYMKKISDRLQSENNGVNKVIFVDSFHPNANINGFGEIMPSIIEIIRDSNRFNREDFNSFNLMIIGIPNVGKSTIINRLRNMYLGVSGKASRTGATPGVTKTVLERIKINPNPPIYLYDTPGVIEPKIDKGLEVMMRCALCATLSDKIIGDHNIADYLLYWMNKHKNFEYCNFFKLDTPSDNIHEVLIRGAINLNLSKSIKSYDTSTSEIIERPDIERSANHFIRAFRNGEFGRVLLDDDFISLDN